MWVDFMNIIKLQFNFEIKIYKSIYILNFTKNTYIFTISLQKDYKNSIEFILNIF